LPQIAVIAKRGVSDRLVGVARFARVVRELSMATRRDLTKAYAREYQRAGKKAKGAMLDELCAATGWSRVNARRAIREAATRKGRAGAQPRKPRPRKYSYDALKVLEQVWTLDGEPCGKYLAPVMDDTLERLLRFRELGKVADRLRDEVLAELRAMSPATIDRYLAPIKAARYPEAASTTRPGLVLRAAIPLRTAMDGFPATPGYLEIDTVAHCGHRNEGDYLVTINATDPHLGWGVTRTVKNKAFVHMKAGMDWILAHYPIPLAGLDFDNGSEFLNWGMLAWCDDHDVPTITRSRPYQHNDNAHVEQRNGDWVRRHAFRYRYETTTELEDLNLLWAQVMARKNHLLPCVKAVAWTQTSSGRSKRIYDKPATPYARLLASEALTGPKAEQLATIHHDLNPAAITRKINTIQNRLLDSARDRTTTRARA
jgi:hypothetical protein